MIAGLQNLPMGLSNSYSFEADFLPVGDGERSGDAIAMRYGYPQDSRVVVVDGGSKESGERLVEHVRNVYKARNINLAVNTHPDADHASGLSVVLESIPVHELWMHQPWNHPEAKSLFRNGAITTAGLSDRIREAVDAAHTLEGIALKRRIPIREPFQGMQFGPLLVMSPTRELYLQLIPHFEQTPAAKFPSPLGTLGLGALGAAGGRSTSLGLGLRGGLLDVRPGAVGSQPAMNALRGGLLSLGLGALASYRGGGLINGALSNAGLGLGALPRTKPSRHETWANESLGDERETSEQNESSVVIYGRFNGSSILFTGDAGKKALSVAWLYSLQCGINLQKCSYYQVPHHGSRQNVSPQILEMILGPRALLPTAPARFAIASVAAGAEDYPRKSVANAFFRRGVSISRTAGSTVSVRLGRFPDRGLAPAKQLPFYDIVDDPD